MALRQLSQQERRTRIRFNTPYAGAVENFRRDALSRPGYDPANLMVFGAVMARALLEMLQAAEAAFGEEGQQVCSAALVKMGREVAEQMLKGVEVPKDMTPVEVVSTFLTWVNEVPYASVEEPLIESEQACSFHIRWCPLQDIYAPLDCRLQRYFVEGILQVAGEVMKDFQVAFDWSIPQGKDTCHFHLWRRQPGEGHAWDEYTRRINQKALQKARGG